MAPKVRTTPQGRQSTLSFKTKVTKPIRRDGKKLVGDNNSSFTPLKPEPKPEAIEPTTREGEKEDGKGKVKAKDRKLKGKVEEKERLKGKVKEEENLKGKAKEEEKEEKKKEEGPPDEVAARKITSREISKYYHSSILESRLSTPLHQSDLTLEEKVLRHFDLSSQYGPCIGITRLNRWKRADKLGLKPPVEVLAVALQMEDQGGKTASAEEKKNRDTRKAYIDDFLSTESVGE